MVIFIRRGENPSVFSIIYTLILRTIIGTDIKDNENVYSLVPKTRQSKRHMIGHRSSF